MKPQLKIVEPGLPPLLYHIQDFLNAKASRADATIAFYELPLRQYCDFVGANFWPPTDSSINAYLADCRKRGLKPNTIYAYYRAIKTWLTWLHKRGAIAHNPIDLVEKPPRSRKVPRAPKVEIIQAFFQAIEDNGESGWIRDRDRALFILLFDTGLRIGEVARLVLPDIHLKRLEIWIAEGKTHSDRPVVFSPGAADSLAGWLAIRSTLDIPLLVEAVFVSHPPKFREWRAFSEDGIRQAKDRYLNRAGLPNFRVHDLRHAYAIYTLMNGGNLEDIRKQLGHNNIATTARYLESADFDRAKRHSRTSPLNLISGDK